MVTTDSGPRRSDTAPPRPDPARRHSIDLIRALAAVGIVWFHMQAPGAVVGYLALPLFLILAGDLAVGSVRRRGAAGFWRRRAAALIGLWLVWSAIYLAVEALRFGPAAALRLDDPLRLLVGPSEHLWFLPFLALALGLAPLAAALRGPSATFGAALLLVPAAAALGWVHDALAPPVPLSQWSVAAIPFAYGLLRGAGAAPLAAPAFAALTAAIGWFGWGSALAPFLALSALAYEALLRLPLRHPWLPALGDLTLGIYIVHPLCALAWRSVATTTPMGDAIAVLSLSVLAAWALARLPSPLGRVAPAAQARR
jgi:peptidoglycan/LPS O-acetylase OafA/YrhL